MSPGVGYIGSGNMSSVFNRKPKVAFEKIKYIYGEELERINCNTKIKKSSFKDLSKKEKFEIRNRIKVKIRKDQNIDRLKSGVSILIAIGIFYIIWHYIFN